MFLIRIIFISFALVSIPILYADRISPSLFWPLGFITFLIPVILFINFILFIFFLFRRSKLAIAHLIPLGLGYEFFLRTFTIHSTENIPADFSVLSYNVKVFNLYSNLRKEDPQISQKMLEWVNQENAEIKCFQEYYNDNQSNVYNAFDKLTQVGKYKYYFTKTTQKRSGASFGLAIYSIFPFVKYGNIEFGSKSNKGVFADLKIKDDTVRIINVHLESMNIDEEKLLNYEKSNSLKAHTIFLAKKLRSGFTTRTGQIDKVMEYIENSPYPVIVCGDFNDLPYSYMYRRFRNILRNTFEDAGRGFGFTYNGKLFFLRIDNQFYSKDGLKALDFKTERDVKFSDHYPIKGWYRLK